LTILSRTVRRVIGAVCSLVLLVAFADCKGGESLPLPAAAPGDAAWNASQAKARTQMVIVIPKRRPRSRGRRGDFISPSTQSLKLSLFEAGSKVAAYTGVVDLTAHSPGCAPSGTGRTCTVTFVLPPGNYTADVATYTKTSAGGSLLSWGQEEAVAIAKGKLNRIAVTLSGVPHSFGIVPQTDSVESSPGGFTMGGIWASPRPFNIVARDAGGNTIVGVGSPLLSVSLASSNFALTPPSTMRPNGFSVTPPGSQRISTTLTATAAFSGSDVCTQPGAICKATFSLVYDPFALDDWTTFAHDSARTGMETRTTGITSSTVFSLSQRWQATIPDSVQDCNTCRVFGSPVVYDGNVIVPSYNGILYDLSAQDGSVLWKRTLASGGKLSGGMKGAFLRVAPVIDADDGLVIIGNAYYPVQASTLYALRISDGSIAWQTTVSGFIRAAPVYANGVVYEGWAGGDEPYCVNGGVSAFNARTGVKQWSWLTNPVTNPKGGGGVWGALGWDGTHLIFGTGNTCSTDMVAQGAVALNPDGSTAWSFQAEKDTNLDDDTGGGVMIQNGTANFINKNGSLYELSAGNGQQILSTPIGGGLQGGGSSTPTSNGSIVVVGAGFFPTSDYRELAPRDALCWNRKVDYLRAAGGIDKKHPHRVNPGFGSFLKAVNPTGSVLWSLPMTNTIDAYSAIANDVVFAPMDANMDAIAISSGAVLTQFAATNDFEAGPVVVPSGLYTVDFSGHVTAFSLPAAGSASTRHSNKPR
jgi:outer membrane protein assembly factor BamB